MIIHEKMSNKWLISHVQLGLIQVTPGLQRDLPWKQSGYLMIYVISFTWDAAIQALSQLWGHGLQISPLTAMQPLVGKIHFFEYMLFLFFPWKIDILKNNRDDPEKKIRLRLEKIRCQAYDNWARKSHLMAQSAAGRTYCSWVIWVVLAENEAMWLKSVNTIMNHSIFVGLYHPFMVNLGMVYYCFTNNICVYTKLTIETKKRWSRNRQIWSILSSDKPSLFLKQKKYPAVCSELRGLLVSIFLITWGAKDPPWVFQPDRNTLKIGEWSPCSTPNDQ